MSLTVRAKIAELMKEMGYRVSHYHLSMINSPSIFSSQENVTQNRKVTAAKNQEVAARLRSMNWAETSLGAIGTLSRSKV